MINAHQTVDRPEIMRPMAALELMAPRVIDLIASRWNIDPSIMVSPKAQLVFSIPKEHKTSKLRMFREQAKRYLETQPSSFIREEFDQAIYGSYNNAEPDTMYYAFAAIKCFYEHKVPGSSIDLATRVLLNTDLKIDEESVVIAHAIVRENVLRFHPLYVAYLYETQGVNSEVRAQKIVEEYVDHIVSHQLNRNRPEAG